MYHMHVVYIYIYYIYIFRACAGFGEALTQVANELALEEAKKARQELKESEKEPAGHRTKRTRENAKIESLPTLILGDPVPSDEEGDGTPKYEEGSGGPKKDPVPPVAKATAAKSKPDPVCRKIDFSSAAAEDTEMTQRDDGVSPPVHTTPDDTTRAEGRAEEPNETITADERTKTLDGTTPAKPAEERIEEPKPAEKTSHDEQEGRPVATPQLKGCKGDSKDSLTDMLNRASTQDRLDAGTTSPTIPAPDVTTAVAATPVTEVTPVAAPIPAPGVPPAVAPPAPATPLAIPAPGVPPAVAHQPPATPSAVVPIPAPGVTPAAPEIPEPSQVLTTWKNKKRSEEQKKIHAKKMCFYRSLDSAGLRV